MPPLSLVMSSRLLYMVVSSIHSYTHCKEEGYCLLDICLSETLQDANVGDRAGRRIKDQHNAGGEKISGMLPYDVQSSLLNRGKVVCPQLIGDLIPLF